MARVTTTPVLAVALLVVAAVSFVLLVGREMPQAAPLVLLDLLRARPFRISVIASVCCFAGQMASYVALPFHLQHAFGQSDLATGLLMTPWPLVVAVAGPLSGRMLLANSAVRWPVRRSERFVLLRGDAPPTMLRAGQD